MQLVSIAALWGAFAAPRIGWDAPPSCPGSADAQAILDRLLADSPSPTDDVSPRVRIEAMADRFVAHVQLGSGERTLEDDAYERLADAAILIVAMAMDPRLGSTPEPVPIEVPLVVPAPDVEAEPSADTEAPPAPAPTTVIDRPAPLPPPDPPVTARRRKVPRALLRASGGIGVGGPPQVTGVAAIGVAAAWPRTRVELDGDVWTPRNQTSPRDGEVGVTVLGWSVGLRGCGSPVTSRGARRFELPLCLGLRTGALRGRGSGDLVPSAASSIWVTATAGLGLWGWINPRIALALDVDAMVALTAPAFRVEPAGHVFAAFPGGVRAIFGPVVRLP